MKQITTDTEVVVAAMRASPMLEVNEDGTMVRRITPLPEDDMADSRSVYAKGFPQEATLEELEEYFKQFGTPRAIRMRRFKSTKDFKGSVFVEFSTDDEASKFLEKKDLKYKETDEQPLLTMTKKAHLDEKHSRRANAKIQKKQAKIDTQVKEALTQLKYDVGTLLHVSNIGDGVTFKEVKAAFKADGVVYADIPYNGNANEAMLRFPSADKVKEAIERAEKENLTLGDKKPTFTVPEGEEEKKIYEKMVVEKVTASAEGEGKAKKKFNKGGPKGKRGGKGGRGDRNDNNKRQNDGDSEQPAKKAKLDE